MAGSELTLVRMSESEDVVVPQDDSRASLQLHGFRDQSAIDKCLAVFVGDDSDHPYGMKI